MADVVQTPDDVREAPGVNPQSAIASVAIVAGNFVRIASSGQGELADCTEQNGACDGIAVSGAVVGQRFNYQGSGTVDPGAALTEGVIYVLSKGGAMAPVGDLASGDFVTALGIGDDQGNLEMHRWRTGRQVQ